MNELVTQKLGEERILNDRHEAFVASHVAIYPKVNEAEGGGITWLKWALLFLFLSFSLSLLALKILAGRCNCHTIFIAGAWVGAANAPPGKSARGALDGFQYTYYILLICAFIGPYGFWYCLHHPLMAVMSEADKTFCCAETFLGKATIAKKAISPDGRWLAEIRETPRHFLIGSPVFEEKFSLSVMDLANGKSVVWPETGQKYKGVNLSTSSSLGIQDFLVDNGLYALVTHWVGPPKWELIHLENEFLRPINGRLSSTIEQEFAFEAVSKEQITLRHNESGEFSEIIPSIRNDFCMLSPNGRILAVVSTAKNADGNFLTRFFDQQLLQWWNIEFWDVANQTILKRYSGYGLNDDALDNYEAPGEVRFLEPNLDGSAWYMVKSDGFIHAFEII